MPDRLHQLQVVFKPAEDRLLLRARSTSEAEFRVWITRRLLRRAWPLLIRALASEPTVAGQSSSESREAMLAFEHEKSLSGMDFSSRYDQQPAALPLGEAPLLASRVQLRGPEEGSHTVEFRSAEDQTVRLKLNRGMLHALCKLIRDAAAKSDWDLELEIGRSPAPASEAGARVLQ